MVKKTFTSLSVVASLFFVAGCHSGKQPEHPAVSQQTYNQPVPVHPQINTPQGQPSGNVAQQNVPPKGKMPPVHVLPPVVITPNGVVQQQKK